MLIINVPERIHPRLGLAEADFVLGTRTQFQVFERTEERSKKHQFDCTVPPLTKTWRNKIPLKAVQRSSSSIYVVSITQAKLASASLNNSNSFNNSTLSQSTSFSHHFKLQATKNIYALTFSLQVMNFFSRFRNSTKIKIQDYKLSNWAS